MNTHTEEKAISVTATLIVIVVVSLFFLITIAAFLGIGLPSTVSSTADGVTWTQDLAGTPFGALALIGVFMVFGTVGVPIALLGTTTGVVAGPFLGFFVSMAGVTLIISFDFILGYRFGPRMKRWLANEHVDEVRAKFNSGIRGVVALRLVPMIPFMIINLLAGVTKLRFDTYMLGSIVGMMPKIILYSFFGSQLALVLKHPLPPNVIILGTLILILGVLTWVLHRLLGKRRTQ